MNAIVLLVVTLVAGKSDNGIWRAFSFFLAIMAPEMESPRDCLFGLVTWAPDGFQRPLRRILI